MIYLASFCVPLLIFHLLLVAASPAIPVHPNGVEQASIEQYIPGPYNPTAQSPAAERPNTIDFEFEGYHVSAGNSGKPNSGTGDPAELLRALDDISAWVSHRESWIPGIFRYSISPLKHEGVIDRLRYTFLAEEIKGYLNKVTVHFDAFFYIAARSRADGRGRTVLICAQS